MHQGPKRSSRYLTVLGVTAAILLFAIQLALTSHANTVTWDEPDHIYSGYRQWQGDFGLNPEHPPLVKYVAALPLTFMRLNVPEQLNRPYRIEGVLGGREFVFSNDADKLVFRAQMAASIFTLSLLLLAFLAGREMFGFEAGFVALGLLVFDPTLLAHGALVTTDAAQACFLLASIYAFYRYVKAPSPGRLVLTGLAVGLALASKHSAVLVIPMLLVVGLMERLRRKDIGIARDAASLVRMRIIAAILVMCAVGFTVLWASYGFRYAAREDGLQLNPPLASQLSRVPNAVEAEVLEQAAKLHFLPESYIYGFAHVLSSANSSNSYLFGRTYPHAVWFYFPVAMLVKSSITFLLLLGLSIWVIATGRLRERIEVLYLVVPALFYLLVAMTSGMNIGIRHILPVYVFLAILIGGAAAVQVKKSRSWRFAILLLLLFQAISVSRAFPSYVSYANEAFGGPKKVWKYVSDSSADWAQQLHAVKRYTDEHHIQSCAFAYFGTGVIDYDYYHIPCRLLPNPQSLTLGVPVDGSPSVDGTVFISAVDLTGFEFGPAPLNPYEQFKSLKPDDVIDSSVFVYRGHFEIPLAAAMAHAQRAYVFLHAKQQVQALQEGQLAVKLAPDSANVNTTMARVLDALGRPEDARRYYETALRIARANHPEFQRPLVAFLEERLASSVGPLPDARP